MPDSAALPMQGHFVTTHWSVVLAAGASVTQVRARALEALCRTYWYPLYAYARRTGCGPEDAKDLTQAFFAYFLEKGAFALAERERGRFRTFLLSAMKNFLINEYHRQRADKRGGGQELLSLDDPDGEARYLAEPADLVTPEALFEKRWATTLLETALERLREQYAETKHGAVFDALKAYLWGDQTVTSCAALAAQLGVSEEAAKKAVQRLRHRYAQMVRSQIAETVNTPAELEDELRHFSAVLRP